MIDQNLFRDPFSVIIFSEDLRVDSPFARQVANYGIFLIHSKWVSIFFSLYEHLDQSNSYEKKGQQIEGFSNLVIFLLKTHEFFSDDQNR